MAETMSMKTTYTHTGRRASAGYMHYGNTTAFRGGATAGKVHALNRTGHGYTAVCGVTVATYSHDHRCEERNPVELASVNPRVTCKACLKRRPQPVALPKRLKHVVFLALCTGEVRRWCEERNREAAERYAASIYERGTASLTMTPGYVINAWVEDRLEVDA